MPKEKHEIELATEKGFENAIIELSRNAWVYTLTKLFQSFGVPFSDLPLEMASKISSNRIEAMISDMTNQLMALTESKIDKDFFSTEEWYDLFLKASDAAIRTRHREKIKLYATILASASVLPNEAEHDPELYLSIITELQPFELRVLNAMYELQKEGPSVGEKQIDWALGHNWKHLTKPLKLDRSQLDVILQRLERTGLITHVRGMLWGADENAYIISELLKKLIHFLQKTDNELM